MMMVSDRDLLGALLGADSLLCFGKGAFKDRLKIPLHARVGFISWRNCGAVLLQGMTGCRHWVWLVRYYGFMVWKIVCFREYV